MNNVINYSEWLGMFCSKCGVKIGYSPVKPLSCICNNCAQNIIRHNPLAYETK